MNVPWFARVIAGVVAAHADAVYVEVGVESGVTIRHVAPGCAEVHGCDVQDCEPVMPSGSTFWHMSSDRFFAEYDGSPAHVIFIDGDHSYEQAASDYIAAREIIRNDGVIALHDTWPVSPENTGPERCGGVYRLRRELEERPDLQVVTLRAFPGLTLVQRHHSRAPDMISG